MLRIAACHLSDISWNDHPDYRAEQAYIRVLHLPAPGMSHRERAILAMTLAYRYKSDPKSAMLDTALRLVRRQGADASPAASAPASGSPTTCPAARPACCRRSSCGAPIASCG